MSLAVIVVIIGLSLTGCKKDTTSNANNPTAVNDELSSAKTSVLRSQAYNDTLVMYWDTAKVRRYNPMLMHYDKLFYKNDSLFNVMYNLFGGQMYNYGIMMNGFTAGGTMGGGGMMGGGSTGTGTTYAGTMSMQLLRNDTTLMSNYYNTMMQLVSKHLAYHNSIFN